MTPHVFKTLYLLCLSVIVTLTIGAPARADVIIMAPFKPQESLGAASTTEPYISHTGARAEEAGGQFTLDKLSIETQSGGIIPFNVELALTPDQHAQGLMNRSAMAQNAGMLFVFPDEGKRIFWMKDTLIPLDMLFLSRDGRIHHIHPMAQPQDKSLITSEAESFAVLELNGGIAGQLGIQVGDRVVHPAFRNVLAP